MTGTRTDKEIPSGLRPLWPKSVVCAKKLLGCDMKNCRLLPLCNSFMTRVGRDTDHDTHFIHDSDSAVR
jgi:hypothetical protein